MTTIHRHEEVDQFHDPFLAEEGNPNLTNAIDSSLWELVSHRRHYHPTVATMARVFEEMFTKPPFSLEDFLDHTYSTVGLCQRGSGPRLIELPDVCGRGKKAIA
jgi:U3 small nucleolar RNA-associated protein 19